MNTLPSPQEYLCLNGVKNAVQVMGLSWLQAGQIEHGHNGNLLYITCRQFFFDGQDLVITVKEAQNKLLFSDEGRTWSYLKKLGADADMVRRFLENEDAALLGFIFCNEDMEIGFDQNEGKNTPLHRALRVYVSLLSRLSEKIELNIGFF